jgi:hypothetical protein
LELLRLDEKPALNCLNGAGFLGSGFRMFEWRGFLGAEDSICLNGRRFLAFLPSACRGVWHDNNVLRAAGRRPFFSGLIGAWEGRWPVTVDWALRENGIFRILPGSSGFIPGYSGLIPGISGFVPGWFCSSCNYL